MKKLIAILVSVIALIVLGTFLFKNQDETNESEKSTTVTNSNNEADLEGTDTGDEKTASFTFEPFTLTMEVDNQLASGKPFEVEASLKNTYNGPITLKAGSKCTEEVTLILTPFEEYKEGQSPPKCKDLTEDIEVLVGDSLDTKAKFTAVKSGKTIAPS